MKVLFDNQVFSGQKHGGISRYFSELFRHFNGINNIEYEMPIKYSGNEYLKSIEPFSTMDLSPFKEILPNIHFKGKNRLCNLIFGNTNINIVRRALKKQHFDIFHPTYYSPYFLKYLKNKPFVLTVHDMIHELYPQYFPQDQTANQKKQLMLRADKIIAISENTKKDIVRFYNIPENKIQVIYHGNSLKPQSQEPLNAANIPDKYILFVGARYFYKNFTALIRAVTPLLKKNKDLNIIAVGNDFSDDEKRMFIELEIEKQIVRYSASDEVLAYLYQNAICFVFPSLYEGFGIPILEAFACKCPVVASNSSSLPEVAGDAAQYFDPMNEQNIREVVERVVFYEKLRKKMIADGQKRLQKFSWEKTAHGTLNVYRSLM